VDPNRFPGKSFAAGAFIRNVFPPGWNPSAHDNAGSRQDCRDGHDILGDTVLGYCLAAVTDLTEIMFPLAVPVTLASSQASLSSWSRLVLFEVSRV
jgi:hypothetical protein